ncbi:MAG: ATP-grasp domain-containing protein [Methanomassiliicoccus sp.]|nr:ATP-grasp domain-containing protein [Methanomassiliicoccus sp.]
MMLLEDQGKRLFREHGIKVPSGRTVSVPEQAVGITGPAMVKALVPAGGRGKGGGVKKVMHEEDIGPAVSALLGATVSGHEVTKILIEEAVPVAREMYLSISIDRSLGLPVLVASASGGIEVETLDASIIQRWTLHPFLGVRQYVTRGIAIALGLKDREAEVRNLVTNLWELFTSIDCDLVEVNPLILATDGALVAADSKISINDDSLFRHPDLELPPTSGDELEGVARAEGLAFVRLDGDIGVIANGAGLTMATLDSLSLHGGDAGAFMDLGGTDDPARVRRAFEIMARSGQKVILVNIFGAMTKCDTVARGLLEALAGMVAPPTIVVRIRGINEEQAQDMLRSEGLAAHTELEGAVMDAVARR